MVKILVVDDETNQLTALQELIGGEGHEVVTTNNGIAAIEAIRSSVRFDLVITDYRMPGANGREVALAARERGVGRVIINSCSAEFLEPIPGVEIVKKMSFEDLDSRVLQPLKRNGSTSA